MIIKLFKFDLILVNEMVEEMDEIISLLKLWVRVIKVMDKKNVIWWLT